MCYTYQQFNAVNYRRALNNSERPFYFKLTSLQIAAQYSFFIYLFIFLLFSVLFDDFFSFTLTHRECSQLYMYKISLVLCLRSLLKCILFFIRFISFLSPLHQYIVLKFMQFKMNMRSLCVVVIVISLCSFYVRFLIFSLSNSIYEYTCPGEK